MEENNLFWNQLSKFYKIFADSTRLRILNSLLTSEKSVTQICEELNMSQSAVSHQLRILRQSKLVKARKSGKEVYYSLSDEHVEMIIKMGKEHVMEED